MNVIAIPALADNYIWLIQSGTEVLVVDPGDANPVLAYLLVNQYDLAGILLTHEHEDHTGGVADLKAKYPTAPIYGPQETQNLVTHIVGDGDSFDVLGYHFDVLLTAGHTAGHISYLTEDCLFCGDALFMAGCGRVFTGDYQAQYQALQRFKQLADHIKVYAGHEYSQTNLKFALTMKPNDPNLIASLAEVEQDLDMQRPSLPSTIGQERQINLFLQAEDLASFKTYRLLRDQFNS